MPTMPIAPYYSNNAIPVIFTCDNRYAPFVGVTIQNIIDCASPTNNYDIIILELGLTEQVKEKIVSIAKPFSNVSVRFFNVTNVMSAYSFDSVAMVNRFPKEVFLPVFVPLLCQQYEKVLCLDADIFITTDIAELYAIDLGTNLIGAVIDFECTIETMLQNKVKMLSRGYITKKLQVNLFHYFNSGILSFNIAQIVQEGLIDTFAAAIPVSFKLPDQDILNYACRNRVTFLPPTWNVQNFAYTKKMFTQLPQHEQNMFLAVQKQTQIMHYTYALKPWFVAGCTRWWNTAKKTPFYEHITTNFLENSDVNPLLQQRKKPIKLFLAKVQ